MSLLEVSGLTVDLGVVLVASTRPVATGAAGDAARLRMLYPGGLAVT